MSRLAELFRHRRIERHLKPADLARLAGYTNLTRGCNRISRLEQTGLGSPEVLRRFAGALGIPAAQWAHLRRIDERQRQLWTGPLRPHYLVRWMSIIAGRYDLPPWVQTLSDAQHFVSETARLKHRPCCLVLPERTIHFADDGRLIFVNKAPVGAGATLVVGTR